MTEAYKPIACALHDEYELAIMHRTELKIKWTDADGETHLSSVLPVDIKVENKEEFLVAKVLVAKDLANKDLTNKDRANKDLVAKDESGEVIQIRLDRVSIIKEPAEN